MVLFVLVVVVMLLPLVSEFTLVVAIAVTVAVLSISSNIFHPLSTMFENMPSLARAIGSENLGDLSAAYSALITRLNMSMKKLCSRFLFLLTLSQDKVG